MRTFVASLFSAYMAGNYTAHKKNDNLIFGIRAIIEAVVSGKEIEALYLQRGLTGGLFQELKQIINEYQLPVQYVPIEKLHRMTPKNHQGAVAVISPIIYQKVEDIIPQVFEKGEVPLILVLDSITDVRNMGAIARTAECSGVHAIVIPAKGSAQINADAVKTSAGALYKIPVCRHDNFMQTVRFLQESGLQLVCCTEKTNDYIYKPDYTAPTAIIMGSEEDGIRNDIIRIADHLARIPMFGEIGSLNVSVSAGVILYEAIRQRTQ
ncbi:23S rRNA (guanosine(2251)-2'-O)-methyltransferase RlmB [Mucilaginibacter daejeonensis]|nr:23S rRNA (guanosine(2251)-2'-O)-methyltransferase RlmB [Mucilaginibacter daejeonensis]UEG51603.1 23S rRNA (guanosine(2251)-2'-O)-methyltransferase RlmB [Mucilaginibacter daejeonensis]